MLCDRVENWSKYAALFPKKFAAAFEWIQKNISSVPAVGKYPLDGKMFAMVQSYATKPLSGGKFENHHNFIDIQVAVKGKERLYWTNPSASFHTVQSYSSEKDVEFFDSPTQLDESSGLLLDPGVFTILWPGDWHMPCMNPAGLITQDQVDKAQLEPIIKFVIKVPVSDN